MKVGVSVWDQAKLWDKSITIIVKSSPELKIEALQLCTEIIENCIVHNWVNDPNLKIYYC